MAPENNTDTFEQAFKNSADLLDELTDELTKILIFEHLDCFCYFVCRLL
jgi:hypothetical protein